MAGWLSCGKRGVLEEENDVSPSEGNFEKDLMGEGDREEASTRIEEEAEVVGKEEGEREAQEKKEDTATMTVDEGAEP